LIGTAPRSGSSLLADGLSNTGRAGAPDEFFDPRYQVTEYWMHRYSVHSITEYANKIIQATTTQNGVFGVKVHWPQLRPLRERMCEGVGPQLTDIPLLSIDERLRARFGAVQYVWLRRKNEVAQAISHYRAVGTNIWRIRRGHPEQMTKAAAALEFDFATIDRYVKMACFFDQHWEHWFRRQGLRPLVLSYEELVGAFDPTIRRVLQFLGITDNGLSTLVPRLERQADQISGQWEARYRALKLAIQCTPSNRTTFGAFDPALMRSVSLETQEPSTVLHCEPIYALT
jgi:LPS sulfotransferase NodH